MGRILALDIGEKKIGVAASDPLFLTAQGITTVLRKNIKQDVEAIRKLTIEYEVDEIIVGLPKSLDGSLGPSAEKVKDFVRKMQKTISLPITEWDERFSTSAMERVLIEADVGRKKRKKVIDKMAAQYILQGYLDLKRNELLSQKKDETRE